MQLKGFLLSLAERRSCCGNPQPDWLALQTHLCLSAPGVAGKGEPQAAVGASKLLPGADLASVFFRACTSLVSFAVAPLELVRARAALSPAAPAGGAGNARTSPLTLLPRRASMLWTPSSPSRSPTTVRWSSRAATATTSTASGYSTREVSARPTGACRGWAGVPERPSGAGAGQGPAEQAAAAMLLLSCSAHGGREGRAAVPERLQPAAAGAARSTSLAQ